MRFGRIIRGYIDRIAGLFFETYAALSRYPNLPPREAVRRHKAYWAEKYRRRQAEQPRSKDYIRTQSALHHGYWMLQTEEQICLNKMQEYWIF